MPSETLNTLDKYLIRMHGIGAPRQYFLYRCEGCGGLMTWKKIRGYAGSPRETPAAEEEKERGGGCRCGTNRLRPTNPTLWEKVKLVALPWAV